MPSSSTSWLSVFLDQAFNDGNSSHSLLLSVALFVGGNLLFHCSNVKRHRTHFRCDDDDRKDGEYRENKMNDEDSLEWTSYLRKRLEHRLSFPSFSETQHTADNGIHHRGSGSVSQMNGGRYRPPSYSFDDEDPGEDDQPGYHSRYSNDFYPKNSNWCHFETPDESKRSSMITKPRSEPKKPTNRQLANQASSITFSRVEKEGSAIFSSLEGDRAASNEVLHENNPTSLHQRFLSDDDDDETTDGDDSQASREHFVWTDAEYRESFRLRKQTSVGTRKASHATLPGRAPLPVILSERHSSGQEIAISSPVHLSQASSLQGSIADGDDDGGALENYGEESDSRGSQSRTAQSTASSLHFAPSGDNSINGAAVPQVETVFRNNGRSSNLPEIRPRPLSPGSETNENLPRAPNPPKRTSSAPLIGSVAPLTANDFRRASSTQTAPNAPLSEHRANYNARIMPHKLILVRHGQSMGNIDETMYSSTPDNAIPLTKLGFLQARTAGQRLRQIIKGSSDVHFIVSPYVRTVETFHGIASAWSDPEEEFTHLTDPLERRNAWYEKLVSLGLSWAEDPRIREQDFGNLQDPAKIKQCKRERNTFGAFYYRFAHGESAADVFDRISTFLDSLWRSFDVHPSRNFVLVTHGIAIRVLLARYFRYTIDQFHLLSNPRNCEMIVLSHDGQGRLRLSGRHELDVLQSSPPPIMPPANGDDVVMHYRFKKRLRVLPSEFVRYNKARLHFEEDEKDNNAV